MPRKHILISGRVQGVGFRYFTAREAERLGLVGWVRNCYDGSVEIEAQGEDDALKRFLAALREGPAHAIVRKLDAAALPESEQDIGFTLRF